MTAAICLMPEVYTGYANARNLIDRDARTADDLCVAILVLQHSHNPADIHRVSEARAVMWSIDGGELVGLGAAIYRRLNPPQPAVLGRMVQNFEQMQAETDQRYRRKASTFGLAVIAFAAIAALIVIAFSTPANTARTLKIYKQIEGFKR